MFCTWYLISAHNSKPSLFRFTKSVISDSLTAYCYYTNINLHCHFKHLLLWAVLYFMCDIHKLVCFLVVIVRSFFVIDSELSSDFSYRFNKEVLLYLSVGYVSIYTGNYTKEFIFIINYVVFFAEMMILCSSQCPICSYWLNCSLVQPCSKVWVNIKCK